MALRKLAVAGCALSLALAFPLPAFSQSEAESTSPRERGRQLFEEATEQLALGNAALARDLLRRSLALQPRIATRYNLGIALRRTGATTEAIDTFEGLLEEPQLSDLFAERTRTQLDGARSELANIRIRIKGADQAKIELDGRGVGQVAMDEEMVLPIDAGEHLVRATAGGVVEKRIEVGPGKTLEVELDVPPAATGRRAPIASVVLWSGAGAALASAAIVGPIALNRENDVRSGCGSTTPPSCEQSDLDKVNRLGRATDALWISGLAMGAAGTIWYFVKRKKDKSERPAAEQTTKTTALRITPWASRQLVGASARLRF